MKAPHLLKLPILFLFLLPQQLHAEDIWTENFSDTQIHNKGYYGTNANMDGITRWSLNVDSCTLSDDNDYVMVVTTSGGRMEAKDCDGEAVWQSEIIDISGYTDVGITIKIGETGSSTNSAKQIKAYYRIDGGDETLLGINGEQTGDWDTITALQQNLSGNQLELVVRFNNPLSSNLVYFDDIVVSGEPVVQPKDTNSVVKEPEIPLISQIIDSKLTGAEQAVEVFRFRISDPIEGDDGEPTKIKSLRIDNAAPQNGASWPQNIAGILLYSEGEEIPFEQTVIGSDSIHIDFSEGQFNVNDDEDREITLLCYLKTSGIEDGKSLQFFINGDAHGFEAFVTGSGFALDFGTDILSPVHTLSVAASRLNFIELPQEAIRDHNFTVEITATDTNGNKDLDANHTVNLTLSKGAGELKAAGGLQQELVNGSLRWEDLQYNIVDEIILKADAEGLEAAESSTISIQAVRSGFAVLPEWAPSDTILSAFATGHHSAHETFRFHLTDAGDDNYPTQVKKIQLVSGAENILDWEEHIQGIVLRKDGQECDVNITLTANTLHMEFPEAGMIENGETGEFSLSVYLKKGGLPDGARVQFRIDPLHQGWEADNNGSDLTTSFSGNLEGPGFTLEVQATQLKFISEFKEVKFSTPFQVEVQCEDIYGNADKHFQAPAFLLLGSGSGTLEAANGLEQLPKNGVYQWDSLLYDRAENFTLLVEAEGLKSALSETISTVDRTSRVRNSQNPVEITALSSLAHSEETAVEVLRFLISDEATHDELPTLITTLKFFNTIPNKSLSWKKHLAGAILTEADEILATAGTINQNEIRFSSSKGVVEIPNGGERELTLSVYFRKTQLPDGETFQCYIPQDGYGWKTHVSGSAFSDTLEASVQSPLCHLEIEATHLFFTSIPFAIDTANVPFNVTVAAGDMYRNIDTDAQNSIMLEIQTGEGILTIPEGDSGALVKGEWTVENLNYSKNEAFTLKASALSENLHSDSADIQVHPSILQLSADFENQDISDWNPSGDWTISSYQPVSGNYSLKHNLIQKIGESYIFHHLEGIQMHKETIIWRFILKNGDWAPSSDNNFCYYLVADQSDPKLATIAYGVGVNQSGSSDLLTLWKFEGEEPPEILIQTGFNWNGEDAVAIEVVHTAMGEWHLKYNRMGSFENMYPVTAITEEIIDDITEVYTGLYFEFGSTSRAGLLWMDDVEIVKIGTPPFLKQIQTLAPDTLKLTFSEDLNREKSGKMANFPLFIEQENVELRGLQWGKSDREIILITNVPLKTASYRIQASGITDMDGEESTIQEMEFRFFAPPSPFDIVINEIMADESPAVGLPEYEYLELHNVRNYPIPLTDWRLQVGSREAQLPADTLEPGGYLILCNTVASGELAFYGKALGVPGFPSLINNGAEVTLFSSSGELIDRVVYEDSWYGDTEKSNGGWSLERIDPENTCSTESNWVASNNGAGGSPGKENSVFASNLDETAPGIRTLILVNDREIHLEFTEKTDSLESSLPGNYILQDIGQPSKVEVTASNRVELEFSVSFSDGVAMVLSVSGISDECGNTMEATREFIWHQAHPFDVVINEIMADENPTVGLPEYEYLELHNVRNYPIPLTDWRLQVGSREAQLPSDTLEPGGYIILCNTVAAGEFASFGNTLGIPGFPSLTNNGAEVTLFSSSGELIDRVVYEDSWYGDTEKSNGGWSLERIDSKNTHGRNDNWKASSNSKGGTPGFQNSIKGENPDLTAPAIIGIQVLKVEKLEVHFSEPLDTLKSCYAEYFRIEPGIGQADSVEVVDREGEILMLHFETPFQPNTTYELVLSEEICDYAGNNLVLVTAPFSLSSNPSSGDLIINEVLFNPFPGNVDFVEILNLSKKIIDLNSLWLANRNELYELDEVYPLSVGSKAIHPGDYVLLTTDTILVLQQYSYSDPLRFWQMGKIPAFPNEKGRVVLLNAANEVIDELEYEENMHFGLLASFEGVSLERINPERPTNGAGNWHSAAQSIGFGSPGLQNSVFREIEKEDRELSVIPQLFSPDNDGVDDQLNIFIELNEPGYVANISIYDARGLEVHRLVRNQLLGTEENFAWDGLIDGNNRAPIGIYVIYAELFHPKGMKKIIKKTCVLGGKL